MTFRFKSYCFSQSETDFVANWLCEEYRVSLKGSRALGKQVIPFAWFKKKSTHFSVLSFLWAKHQF